MHKQKKGILWTFKWNEMPRRDNIVIDVISGFNAITRIMLINMICIFTKANIGSKNISSRY